MTECRGGASGSSSRGMLALIGQRRDGRACRRNRDRPKSATGKCLKRNETSVPSSSCMSFPSSSYAASSSSSSSYRYARLAFLMVDRAPAVVVATDLAPGDELKKSFGSSMPSSSRRVTAFVMPVFLCVKTRGFALPLGQSCRPAERPAQVENSPATVVSEHVLVGSLCASCALGSDGRPAVRLSLARALLLLLLLLLVGGGRLVRFPDLITKVLIVFVVFGGVAPLVCTPTRGALLRVLLIVVVVTAGILFRIEECLWSFVPCRVARDALWGRDVGGPVRRVAGEGQRVNHLGGCKRGKADLPASPMLLLTCGRGPRCLPGVGGAILVGSCC